MEITSKEREQLLKSQQGELDAVLLYRKLAELAKEPKDKETLLKIAADEGRHAAILGRYTGENLKQKNTIALIITSLRKVIGSNLTLRLLAKAEFSAVGKYSSLVDKFPDIQEIMNDEEMHGKLLSNMIK